MPIDETPPLALVYELTSHETVTLVSVSPTLLEADVRYAPGGRLPPAHVHPAQEERFEVTSGELRVVLDGRERVLEAGQSIEIPRGRPHRMNAAGLDGVRARWSTWPALRTEEWWAALAAARRRCGGDPPLPVLARLLRRYDAEFRLALPSLVERPLVGLLAVLPELRRPRA